MSGHDPILKELLRSKGGLDKVGTAISAKDKADITKNIQNVAGAMQKAIAMAAQRKQWNDHINALRKQVDDYIKKLPDQAPLNKLIELISEDAGKFADAAQKLADDLKKKKDDKNAKALADIASAFGSVAKDTESIVIFIGTS